MIYGYIRKSSEEGASSSFSTQKFKIQSYCNLHNLKIDEYFEDICSGGLLLNQREQGMLLSTKLAKGDSIICSALDRYSRSHYGLVNDVEKYKRLKIKLIFTDLGDVISSDVGDANLFTRGGLTIYEYSVSSTGTEQGMDYIEP